MLPETDVPVAAACVKAVLNNVPVVYEFEVLATCKLAVGAVVPTPTFPPDIIILPVLESPRVRDCFAVVAMVGVP